MHLLLWLSWAYWEFIWLLKVYLSKRKSSNLCTLRNKCYWRVPGIGRPLINDFSVHPPSTTTTPTICFHRHEASKQKIAEGKTDYCKVFPMAIKRKRKKSRKKPYQSFSCGNNWKEKNPEEEKYSEGQHKLYQKIEN